jgi:hypothetical protein
MLSAEEEFARVIRSMKGRRDRRAAIDLADATRRFLSRVDPRFHRELTSFELLDDLRRSPQSSAGPAVANILFAGDLAKFAPWDREVDPRIISDAESLLNLARVSSQEAS